jgi:hypothetical protein
MLHRIHTDRPFKLILEIHLLQVQLFVLRLWEVLARPIKHSHRLVDAYDMAICFQQHTILSTCPTSRRQNGAVWGQPIEKFMKEFQVDFILIESKIHPVLRRNTIVDRLCRYAPLLEPF